MSSERKGLARKPYEGDKIPGFTKVFYPFSGIFRDACYALIGTFLLQYVMYSGILSSNPDVYTAQMNVVTIALIVALIWDGFNDPIMGFIVEKCHFKAGKFKPWILLGAIGNSIIVVLMFIIRPTAFDGWLFVGILIALYVLWDIFFTMNDIGYWSMLPSLTSDEKERNSVTTRVTIATTIGAFLMNIVCFIGPGTFPNLSTAGFYMYCSIGAAALFLLSQAGIYFFCQEKKRDEGQEAISEKASIKDLFTTIGKNRQLLVVVIGILLYYLCASLLTSIALNYFYFTYGYGGTKGGFLASALSIIYVVGTLSSQCFYTLLAKKLSKKTLLTISFFVILVSYIAFLCIAFPIFSEHPLAYSTLETDNSIQWLFSGTIWTLFIPAFLFFAAQGVFYLVILVMMQNSIEYNEWRFGERKESIVFAWRPLTAKISSALQKGVMNLTFIISGLYTTALVPISSLENQLDSGAITNENFTQEVNSIIDSIKPEQLAVVGYIIIGLIVILFLIAFLLLRFGYKIDETNYKMMVDEIEMRKEKGEEYNISFRNKAILLYKLQEERSL